MISAGQPGAFTISYMASEADSDVESVSASSYEMTKGDSKKQRFECVHHRISRATLQTEKEDLIAHVNAWYAMR